MLGDPCTTSKNDVVREDTCFMLFFGSELVAEKYILAKKAFFMKTIDTQAETSTRGGRRKGFASMHPDKQRKLASLGGKKAHALRTAHRWSSEEAQVAGRKGGTMSRRRPRQQG
jgi:uncharacterized protein